MIVALAGGVGGAKLAQGLASVSPDLTVIVNTGDDFDLYGLRICPDLDTVLYTLAGLANPATGWGIAGDTTHALDAMTRLGEQSWFTLGDQDLGTHLLRTERLRAGQPLSRITGDFARALGLQARLVPMTDDRVATLVDTPAGKLEFQDYFVRRRHQDDVLAIELSGIEAARPAPGVLQAIADAELIIFCPSNPIVSIGPILAVPGIRGAIEATAAPVVAVSPIIGGQTVKGPADRMLETLGHERSAYGVAAIYAGLLDGFVIDHQDREMAGRINALGLTSLVTQTIMGDATDRARLASEVVDFARSLEPHGVARR
ncbi:MAG TPA: 2-phospho-L-lactate transferase [Thermomicrobiales bacterium]|nr:2-phospho-L-lactate transferase [Thermomicrobiales bacterium]